MNRWYRGYFIAMTVILALLGMVIVCRPANTFSQNENRVLQTLPELHWKDVMSGVYQKKIEEAGADQVPGRDVWTKLSSQVKQFMGYKDIQGVYLGKETYLISKKTEEDMDKFQYMEHLRYVEYIANHTSGQTGLLLVPSAGTVLEGNLPKFAPFYQGESMYQAAETVCEKAHVISVLQEMKRAAANQTVYYRTDHHWTLQGAYIGYQAFCETYGLTAKKYRDFVPEKQTEDFLGTLHSKVLAYQGEKDVIYSVTQLPDITSIQCDGKEKKSIYAPSKLREKDKYGYYFGGNYGLVTLKMASSTGRRLIVCKDSFANCFVPFLLEQYDEIVMIDLRYYRKSVKSILQQYDGADCLILYEMSNFVEDSNIWKMIK